MPDTNRNASIGLAKQLSLRWGSSSPRRQRTTPTKQTKQTTPTKPSPSFGPRTATAPPGTLARVLRVHPLMVADGQIVNNPFYSRPEELDAESIGVG